MRRVAAFLLVAVPVSIDAAQDSGERRAQDAAEAVREGDVSQWLKYYQRERDVPLPAPQPAGSPQPAAQPEGEGAAPKR